MKRTNVNISMWDVVSTIPLQKELSQKELENIKANDQLPRRRMK